MAQIGTFACDENGIYAGTIKALALSVKAAIKRIGNHAEWVRLRMIGKDAFGHDGEKDHPDDRPDPADGGNTLEPLRD